MYIFTHWIEYSCAIVFSWEPQYNVRLDKKSKNNGKGLHPTTGKKCHENLGCCMASELYGWDFVILCHCPFTSDGRIRAVHYFWPCTGHKCGNLTVATHSCNEVMNVSAAKDNQIARFTVCARAADHENFSPQHYAWNLFPFPFCCKSLFLFTREILCTVQKKNVLKAQNLINS